MAGPPFHCNNAFTSPAANASDARTAVDPVRPTDGRRQQNMADPGQGRDASVRLPHEPNLMLNSTNRPSAMQPSGSHQAAVDAFHQRLPAGHQPGGIDAGSRQRQWTAVNEAPLMPPLSLHAPSSASTMSPLPPSSSLTTVRNDTGPADATGAPFDAQHPPAGAQGPTYATAPPAATATATTATTTATATNAARTRFFDPARDLNPVAPSAPPTQSSPTSTVSSARWSEIDGTSHGGSRNQSVTSRSSFPRSGPEPLPKIQTRFHLQIIEHPSAARASTFGDRDRRVINPPPILQLSLKDFDPDSESDRKMITWPYNIVHCTLWRTPDLQADISECVEVTAFDPSSRRREGGLMGTLVANPFVVEAPNNDGYDRGSSAASRGPRLMCYYIFHDLSCRTTGQYRLRFELTHIGEDFLRPGAVSPTVAYAWSNAFEVHSAKDFPGVQPSSELLKYLKLKGANVTIKRSAAPDSPTRKRARPGVAANDVESTANQDAKRPRESGRQEFVRNPADSATALQFPEQSGPGG